jgi:hypothetical protein
MMATAHKLMKFAVLPKPVRFRTQKLAAQTGQRKFKAPFCLSDYFSYISTQQDRSFLTTIDKSTQSVLDYAERR